MLVTRPIEREVFSPEFHESKKGTGCEEEEKGHEDRSEKNVKHNTADRRDLTTSTRGVCSERRCKGRYKKSTPKEECENSADNAKTLRKLCEISASYSKILRLFIRACFTEITWREVEFILKTIKDYRSLSIRRVLI